ncbi:MAG TPA: hypothetical protein ENI80_03415 [Acidiferrobacteraceae bacterium]|nr:hypothetical protein [Acidiferrobacteraceae bacterium]
MSASQTPSDPPPTSLWASRKTWAFFVTLFIVTVLLVTDQLDKLDYVQIIKYLVPSYIAGNVGEHATRAWRGRGLSRMDSYE